MSNRTTHVASAYMGDGRPGAANTGVPPATRGEGGGTSANQDRGYHTPLQAGGTLSCQAKHRTARRVRLQMLLIGRC